MGNVGLKRGDERKVQQFVAKLRNFSGVPGIAVSMNVDGNCLDACAGVSNALYKAPLVSDQYFEAGCITKFLTSLAALDLVLRSVISLDDPISAVLPELQGENGDRIKIRDLLSHTAGYQGEDLLDGRIIGQYSWDEFDSGFNDRCMLFPPGKVFDYSQSASALLGRIILRATGSPAANLIRKRFLSALGVEDGERSSASRVRGHIFNPVSQRYVPTKPVAWGEFWTDSLLHPQLRLKDLVMLGAALISGNAGLDPRLTDLMATRSATLPHLFGGEQTEDVPLSFGLGAAEYAPGIYGWCSSSASQTCAVRIDLVRQVVVGVAINAAQPFTRDFLIKKLLNSLIPPAEAVARAANRPVEKFSAAELVGKYDGRMGSSFHLSSTGERIALNVELSRGLHKSVKDRPITLQRNGGGDFVPIDDLHSLSLGAFRTPTCRDACFMIGLNAFRRSG
jgi:CubicO group peptidase (beta-lactamase class C family)